MENVSWGAAPSQRTKKVEKYDIPVLTMVALEKEGARRKFTFNKAAVEMLGLKKEDSILFGYSTITNEVFLKKEEGRIKVTNSFSFSDQKTFDTITKRFGLSNDVENEFLIDATDNEGVFSLLPLELKERKEITEPVTIFSAIEDQEIVEDDNEFARPIEEETEEETEDEWSNN